MDKINSNDSSILSFTQDAGFYLRAGRKKAEEGNLVSALHKIRKAYELDPQSEENVNSLSALLNRMQRYEESARILLRHGTPEELSSEGLFNLASDFLGMEEFGPAKNCLLLYLSKFKGGEFAASCRDYLSLMDNEEEFSWQLGLEDGDTPELITCIHLSKAMHSSYLDAESLDFLKSLTERFPDSLWLQTEIALSEFFLGKLKEAEFRAVNILKKDKDYIRAKCLLAYIRLNANKRLEAIDLLSGIEIPTEPDFEALGMLSSVCLEVGLYEKAEESAETLLSFLPYDPLSIHQCAYAKYMLGKNTEALELYQSIPEMDPDDTVAGYYIDWLNTHPNPAEGVKGFMVAYDVSYSEALERFKTMSQLFENEPEKAKEIWASDTRIRNIFNWALYTSYMPDKKAVLFSVSAIGDSYAVEMLLNFLLRTDQSDGDKQRIVSALPLMNVTKPLCLYYKANWLFGIKAVPVAADLPRGYKKTAERLTELANDPYIGQETADAALEYFNSYVQVLNGNYPPLNMFQREAMAAALVYLAMQSLRKESSLESVANYFNVSLTRIHNALDRLLRYLAEDKNEDEDSQQ